MIHENFVKVQINNNANSKRILHHCGGVRNKRDSAILRNSLPNRVIYQACNYLPCGQKLFVFAFRCFNLEIPEFINIFKKEFSFLTYFQKSPKRRLVFFSPRLQANLPKDDGYSKNF